MHAQSREGRRCWGGDDGQIRTRPRPSHRRRLCPVQRRRWRLAPREVAGRGQCQRSKRKRRERGVCCRARRAAGRCRCRGMRLREAVARRCAVAMSVGDGGVRSVLGAVVCLALRCLSSVLLSFLPPRPSALVCPRDRRGAAPQAEGEPPCGANAKRRRGTPRGGSNADRRWMAQRKRRGRSDDQPLHRASTLTLHCCASPPAANDVTVPSLCASSSCADAATVSRQNQTKLQLTKHPASIDRADPQRSTFHAPSNRPHTHTP